MEAREAAEALKVTGTAIMATLRNAAIGWHRTDGETDIARATRRADRPDLAWEARRLTAEQLPQALHDARRHQQSRPGPPGHNPV